MNIIASDILKSDNDVFWTELPVEISTLKPRPVLVLARKMEEGGTEFIQLQKMLSAAKLSADQYNIVMMEAGQHVAWYRLREALQPAVVFIIGILPTQLGVSSLFQLHEPNRFDDTVWLPSVGISELEEHPALKKHLWTEGMKPIFIDMKYGSIAQES